MIADAKNTGNVGVTYTHTRTKKQKERNLAVIGIYTLLYVQKIFIG